MADITRYVDTDVVGGLGDGTSWANAYSSLSAWNTAEATDLTTANDTHTVYVRASGGTADTTGFSLSGWTTSATYDLTIEGATRLGTSWNTNLYRLEAADTTVLYLATDYVTIRYLQVGKSSSSDHNQACIYVHNQAASNSVQLHDCILKNPGNASYREPAIYVNDADTLFDCWNTIMYGTGNLSAGSNVAVNINNCATVNFYNCTIFDGYNNLFRTAGTVNLYNCACGQAENATTSGTFNTIDYCCSDDGAGTNAQTPSGSDWSNEMSNPGTDFALLSGGNCVGNGTDNPGSGLYSDDITGTARTSTWDIGADEYIAGGGSENSHYYILNQ